MLLYFSLNLKVCPSRLQLKFKLFVSSTSLSSKHTIFSYYLRQFLFSPELLVGSLIRGLFVDLLWAPTNLFFNFNFTSISLSQFNTELNTKLHPFVNNIPARITDTLAQIFYRLSFSFLNELLRFLPVVFLTPKGKDPTPK